MRGPSPENSENFCPLAGQRGQAETSSTVLETENARPSCWPEVAMLVRLICVISQVALIAPSDGQAANHSEKFRESLPYRVLDLA